MRRTQGPGYNTKGYPQGDPFKTGQIRFSKTEILHIAASMAVLSVAFTILFRNSVLDPYDPTRNIILIAGMSVILVVCSFLFHEFGHKFVAQKYKAWSEFRAYPYGLVMALVSAMIGFLFAAPGAVYIQGNISKENYGRISLAGPAVNFTIAAIAIVVVLILEPNTIAAVIFYMLAWLNAFMGMFNMIPVMPFDGSKIVAWSIPVYIVTAAIGAAMLIFVWVYL
jgi:Zn-dependent protease